jgi:NADPH2:quinone reductase
VVFDGLGGGFTGAAIEALEPHGRLVLFGASAGADGQVPLKSLYGKASPSSATPACSNPTRS